MTRSRSWCRRARAAAAGTACRPRRPARGLQRRGPRGRDVRDPQARVPVDRRSGAGADDPRRRRHGEVKGSSAYDDSEFGADSARVIRTPVRRRLRRVWGLRFGRRLRRRCGLRRGRGRGARAARRGLRSGPPPPPRRRSPRRGSRARPRTAARAASSASSRPVRRTRPPARAVSAICSFDSAWVTTRKALPPASSAVMTASSAAMAGTRPGGAAWSPGRRATIGPWPPPSICATAALPAPRCMASTRSTGALLGRRDDRRSRDRLPGLVVFPLQPTGHTALLVGTFPLPTLFRGPGDCK